MSNMCVIIEVEGAGDWPATPHGGEIVRIPVDRRPSVLQPDRPTADAEAVRLAAAFPGRRYVVFEAVAAGVTIKVPTHITLGGHVVSERNGAKLVAIVDDKVPF